jgi:hypothetical protein
MGGKMTRSNYQPIETAPKDNYNLLTYDAVNSFYVIGFFDETRGHWVTQWGLDRYEPTHWIYIPEYEPPRPQ